jgi:hypothetical protein
MREKCTEGREGREKSGRCYRPEKEERGIGNKAEENCRKYATEMKNEKSPAGSAKEGERTSLH